MRQTKFLLTIKCFDRIFATHSLPRTIVSDYGRLLFQFQSDKISRYIVTNNIQHDKVKLLWPKDMPSNCSHELSCNARQQPRTAAGHVPRPKSSAPGGVGQVSNYIKMLPVGYYV